MRPKSIVMFERLFLASLAISVLGIVMTFDKASAQWASDPNIQRVGLGSGFLIGAMAFSYALYLLLWFLTARKASNLAKWILVVFVVIGLFGLPGVLRQAFSLATLASLAVFALEIASMVYLFRPDARAWLKGEAGKPDVFD